MATFLFSSVKSCEGGHVLSHHLLEKRGSGLLVLKGKEYGNGHLSPFFSRELWRWPMPSSSREEEVCHSSPKKEEVMTKVILFPSSVESCRGDHG